MPDDETTELVPDAVLLASVDLAKDALREITPSRTIGEPAGYIVEADGVLSLLFECRLSGYPGWHWTVSLSRVDDESAPNVLEAELLPGERALLAPQWVPWSDRLAEQQAAKDDDDEEDTESDDDDDFDDDDDDLEDDIEDDLDGVDLDALDDDEDR